MAKRKPKARAHPDIQALDSSIKKLSDELDALAEKRRTLAVELITKKLAERNQHIPLDTDIFTGDVHECEDSPTGLCVYDDEEDRCHDSCLFCGQPEERK